VDLIRNPSLRAERNPPSWLEQPDQSGEDPRIPAFDLLPFPALVVERDGIIAACTLGAANLLDVAPARVIGQPLWWWLASRGGVEQCALTLRTASGDQPVTVRNLSLPGAAGRTVLLLQPCDPQVPAEQEGDDASTFLVDLVAHELRSLLLSFDLSLSGLAELATALGRDERRLVGTLQRSGVHLQMLLANLLNASTIRSNRFDIERREVDLAQVVQEAVLVVEPLLGAADQEIAVDLPPEPLWIEVDSQHLRHMLVNLLHNAIKHGPVRETIDVRAARIDEVMLLEVHDRGPGIPIDEQPLLFDRFYRGAAHSAGQGSGLGLAIARAIVQAHGGEIGVRSAPGSGTTFWCALPVTAA
jgi:signal transduction histidine kinase